MGFSEVFNTTLSDCSIYVPAVERDRRFWEDIFLDASQDGVGRSVFWAREESCVVGGVDSSQHPNTISEHVPLALCAMAEADLTEFDDVVGSPDRIAVMFGEVRLARVTKRSIPRDGCGSRYWNYV